MPAPPSRSMQDYRLDFFKSIVDGTGPVLFGTINTNQTNGLPTVQNVSDLYGYGEITSPTTGQTIGQIVAVPAGTYDFNIYTNISGTTGGIDRPNMQFQIGAASGMVLLSTLTATNNYTIRAVLATSANVQVIVGANGTAASVYRATILARRLA